MRVYSAAIATALALTVAAAQTSTSTTTVSASSSSGNSITATAGSVSGSVSCVFRYSMPTATNLPSGVVTTTSSTTSSGSEDSDTNGSTDVSGSVGDGSEDSPGMVDVGSDSASASVDTGSSSVSNADSSASVSGSGSGSTPATTTKTPTSTTKTPTSTTKTPTATTKTPTSTTKTPTSTTKTPSTSTSDSSTNSATTSPSTSTTTGSSDGRRLAGMAGEAGAATTTTVSANVGVTAAVSSESSASTGSADTTTTTTAPSATTATPSSTTKTPSSTTKAPTTSTTTSTTAPTTSTTTGSSSTTGSAGVVGSSSTSGSTTIEFSCDSTFYGAWSKMGLTCEGTELDAESAAASTECLIYSGTSSGTEISDLSTCMSVCRFPACNNGTWDYSATDGINSDIYADLDFLTLMGYAGTEAAESVVDAVEQPFSNLTFAATTECDYTSDSSFSACQCAGVTSTASSSSSAGTSTSSNTYTVPANKGLEDSNHWADGTTKTTVDKAGIASTTIGSSAATVSVVAGGVMSVASGVVGGTSAGVASGVSAAASVGITMAAVDICQFSIMLNQMNVDARPRFMENMGKKMAPAAFTFLPFGKTSSTSSDSSSSSSGSTSTSSSGSTASRRLTTGSSTSGSSSSGSGSSTTTTGVQGMEKYASLIGVDPDMLFYLAVAGIACMVACLFGAYAIAMGVSYFIVEDFPTFSKKWLDKAIGVLMMILILSEYVVGATAMYQICYCIDNDAVDVSFFLAIITLLGLAFGTILYGVLVIKNNEDELRDLGTKDHFDKKFHARYGPLYDEHSFEGRFFFAPKLLLALLCGMTTGMVWIQGLWQIVVLIAFHIVFLLYLEIKQPYPTAFVQKTSSFVIIIKISALFLSFFLLSSATSFTESIPDDLREGVAFAIVGLQVLVLVCLMIRQVYIFYRTWKLKRDGPSEEDDKTVTVQTTNAREGSEAFFALGGEPQYYGNNTQSRGNSLAVLGDEATPKIQDPRQYAQETPSNANYNYNGNRLRGLQPQGSHGMTRTHTVVQHETQSHHRNNEVDL